MMTLPCRPTLVLLLALGCVALHSPQLAAPRRCLASSTPARAAVVQCVALPSEGLQLEADGEFKDGLEETASANDVLEALALDEADMAATATEPELEEEPDFDENDPHAAPRDDPERPPIAMFNVDETTVSLLAEKGINNFTPIQAQSYDMLRAGRDMLGRSRTGTGKTLAFALPLVQRLAEEQRHERPERGRLPRMIVLAPTRELAKQVGEVIGMLGQPHRMQVHVFVGGTPYPPQQRALNNGIDVLVGTPGRIIDHLTNGDLDLSNVASVVLDEADEMLNMGFKDDVETILDGATSANRQTVLFSATQPPWVSAVSRAYQTNPVEVDAVGVGQSEAATTVEHRAILTPQSETARVSTLADVIAVYGTHESRTIVFTSTKREVDELSVSGPLSALSPQPLHGDVSQSQRDLTLKRFRDGHFPVLVATDVAARGIDISGVDLIVQYRMPQDPDSYVHRSGRTGRAGRSGVSLVLYTEREGRDLNNLERRANVRFEKSGPPSISTVMAAAATLVPRRLAVVQPKVEKYFEEAAQTLLDGDDVLGSVAKALALVAGKVSLTERSLLTGQNKSITPLSLPPE